VPTDAIGTRRKSVALLPFHLLVRKTVSFLTLQETEGKNTERSVKRLLLKNGSCKKESRLKWETECRQNVFSEGERKKN
jgi:hypothetical protein